jgi:hypothetical protein
MGLARLVEVLRGHRDVIAYFQATAEQRYGVNCVGVAQDLGQCIVPLARR